MNYKWNNAELYESYVGRWSRLASVEFLNWLNMKSGLVWMDVGCGTGALSGAILKSSNPKKIIGIEPSESQIEYARESIKDTRAEFLVSDAAKLIINDDSVDVIVSGLVLNFIPDLKNALAEFKRVTKTGGTVAAYVWDYSGKMELMRYFWDAAVRSFEEAREIDEAAKFVICNPERLADAFNSAGFKNTEVTYIDVPTVFEDFDDYWTPFLSGIGPAPGYCMSLSEEKRDVLKNEVYRSLPIEKDGSIKLIARAIAVKAEKL